MPRMLRDIVASAVDAEADMQLVGESADPVTLGARAAAAHADVVVLALSGCELPPLCDRLLCEYPHASVLAIGADGRGAFRYELRPRKVRVEDVSPSGLLEAIRTATRTSIC
jgi:hypothetical protein